MSDYSQDRWDITDLMMGWMHRDLSEWGHLRALFHSDATIEVTWFEGRASEFVDASMRMGASDLSTKHLVSPPVVAFHGDRAIVETNAVIVAQNACLRIGCSNHNRFYDMVERRGGTWKIVRRQSIYDMGSFTFPHGPYNVDSEIVQRYPREYAPLAYVLEKSGFPVKRVFATRGSDLEKAMKTAGQAWLTA